MYVDDIIVASPSPARIAQIQSQLEQLFKLKVLGKLRYFLGLEIARAADGISLSQRKYTLSLLQDTGFMDCKPASLPMDPNLKLSSTIGEPLPDITQYRRLIGRLLYLTISRPDICFTVNKLSQFMAAPTTAHLDALHHLLRYLKGTPGTGLFFATDSPLHLSAYADSDWANCPDTRKSTSGYCVFLGNSLISWKSKKQQVVSRSSAEAEYRSLASVASEIQWLTSLLKDFELNISSSKVFSDSQSAIHLASNPIFHERSKHIEIDCHFIREKVLSNIIKLIHVPSAHQLADILTKPVTAAVFQQLISKLGLHNIFSPT